MTTVASAVGGGESGGDRRLLAEVPRQVDHREARILPVMLQHDLERAVGAAVVDVDHPGVEMSAARRAPRAGG